MTSKRSRTRATALPAGADDFQSISGIGPAVESLLHEAGIRTFGDLAARSPDDIAALLADVKGMSAQRIEDWIAQARERAAASTPAERHDDISIPAESQDDETNRAAWNLREGFRVELLLEENRKVHHTLVYHLRGTDVLSDDKWAGWDEAQLLGFIKKHATFDPQTTEPAPSEAGTEEPQAPSSPTARVEEPPAELRLAIGDISLEEVPIEQEVGEQARPTRLRALIKFQLSGQADYLFKAQQSPYFVQVFACDLASGQTTVLTAEQQQLQSYTLVTAEQQPLQSYTLSFTATVEFGLPYVGRYQLLGTILLSDSNIVETALGPIFKVVP